MKKNCPVFLYSVIVFIILVIILKITIEDIVSNLKKNGFLKPFLS